MPRSRFSVGAALAAVIIGALAVGSPASAQSEGNGLDETSVNTFLFDASEGVLRVTVEINLTNVTTDRRDGNIIRQQYFDGYYVAVPLGAENIVATRNGSVLDGELTSDPEFPAFSYYEFSLGRRIFSGQSTNVTVTYDHLGAGPRNDVPWRVNEAYASYVAFGLGDDEQVTINVLRPAGYEFDEFTDLEGFEQGEPDGFGSVTFTRTGLSEDFDLIVGMSNDDRLAVTPLEVDGVDIELRSWPDDLEWTAFATELVESGIPELEELIGWDWPIDEPFEMKQTIEPYLYGYAGWFDTLENEIAVGEELDAETIYHELSHAWFNNELASERWINEGLAQIYAAELVRLDGDEPAEPSVPPVSFSGGQPLADWSSFDPTDAEEDYGYNASFYVFDRIEDEIGFDGFRAVLLALDQQSSLYAPDDVDTTISIGGWRRMLDLFEIAGTSEGAADLLREYVISDDDEELLAQRSDAQSAFADLTERLETWSMPDDIPTSMGFWRFERAVGEIDLAAAALDRRDEVAALTATTGVVPPDVASELFAANDTELAEAQLAAQVDAGESLAESQATLATIAADAGLTPPAVSEEPFHVSDFAAGSAVVTDQLATIDAVNAAADAAAIEPSFVEKIGLRGTDVDGMLDAARAAIDRGDNEGARELATDAQNTLDAAADRGQRQLATLGALVVGIVLALLAVLLLRRRKKKLRPNSGGGLLGVAGEDLDGSGVDLDEDALAGAHLGGVDNRADVSIRDGSQASGSARVVAGAAGLGDVRDAVLELDEDVVAMVDTDAVTGTEVLIDPHTHDSE